MGWKLGSRILSAQTPLRAALGEPFMDQRGVALTGSWGLVCLCAPLAAVSAAPFVGASPLKPIMTLVTVCVLPGVCGLLPVFSPHLSFSQNEPEVFAHVTCLTSLCSVEVCPVEE